MKDLLDAPIEYDASRRGYYYTEKTWRLPMGFSGSRDMAALAVVKSFLLQYRNNPVYDAVLHLLDTISASWDQDNGHGAGGEFWAEKRIVSPPVASVAVDEALWKALCDSLRTNSVVTFDYRGGWDTEAHPRRARPFQLLFDAGAWYLYAHDEARQARRVFSLARMRNLLVLKERFTLPADFAYRSNGSYFGVFESGDREEFSINFFGWAAVEVKERVWAEGQVVTPIEGGVNIRFTSSQYDKVFRWTLAKGKFARPLAPERLVADWEDNAATMTGREAAVMIYSQNKC
jgi:predicted DNA-binding transcriptional regulator YafY